MIPLGAKVKQVVGNEGGEPQEPASQTTHTGYEFCIGPRAQGCIGCIFDNEGLMPTVGINLGISPIVSGQRSSGKGSARSGLFVYAGFIWGFTGVNLNGPIRHPFKEGAADKTVGVMGAGVGVQYVFPPLKGTTELDWKYHPDNPKRKGLAWHPVGRCPF